MRVIGDFKKMVRFGCLLGLVAVVGVTGHTVAEEIDYEGPFLKLNGGLNFALDSDFKGSSSELFPSGEATLGGGTAMGLSGGYRFNRNFAGELEYTYRSNDIDKIKSSGGSQIADGGDLASVAIMANGYYYLDYCDSWSPYVGLGVGFLQEIDSDIQMVGISDQKDLEDSLFAWQAAVGAEVPLDERWRFYGEGRFLSAPGAELSNGKGSYKLDYNNLSLMIGIGYQF